jgi:hypothetical protein
MFIVIANATGFTPETRWEAMGAVWTWQWLPINDGK